MIRYKYFLIFLLLSAITISSYGQLFKVSGSTLLDPNGNDFVMKGVNSPHIWFYGKSYKSIETISDLKANTIRIVWETKGSPGKLENILKECVKEKVIAMVELHDATGDTSSEGLMRMVNYYTDKKVQNVLKKYEKYLLINIANEWGRHETTDEFWKENYQKAITSLRDAGYKTTLVIDASGWGQKIDPILKYGKDLLAHDPLNNILFSVHMYGSWNDPNTINTKLQEAYDLELPLIVGEFGYEFDKGFNNLKCKVDHASILKKCAELNYGYLAWSWSGNNKVNAWLDLSDKRNWETLTWWGRQVFNSEFGISKTAKLASIFPNETEEEKEERLKEEAKTSKKRKKAAAKAKKERLKREKLEKKKAEKKAEKEEKEKSKSDDESEEKKPAEQE